MKICPNCQQSNPDDANFCSSCGMPLTNVASEKSKPSSLPAGFTGRRPDFVSMPENKVSKTPDEQQLEELARSGGLKVEYEPDDEPKKEESQEDEKKEDSDEKEDSPKSAIIAVVLILSALVLLLGGIVVMQMIDQTKQSEPSFNPPEIGSLEESKVTYFDSSYHDDWKNSRPADEGEQEFEDLSEPSSSNETTPSTSSTPNSSNEEEQYRALYVMKIRNQPSIDGEQVGRVDQYQIVSIVETKKASDDSVWGRLADSTNWVCISDAETTYLEKE